MHNPTLADGQASGPERDLEVSFEFFPPKTAEAQQVFWQTVKRLESVKPRFVSVTYGAGGSTRERSLDTVRQLAQGTSLTPAAHLTCVDASKTQVESVVRGFAEAGVKHIVALRGDPPQGVGAKFQPHPEGYGNAADLIAGIKSIGEFEISVATYPEKHPESFTLEVDLAMLAAKVDNGASRALTQFFFDNSAYLRFLDRARARRINIPIVPGILPVTNFAKVKEFAFRCGATIPAAFARRFEGLESDPETTKLIAVATAVEQVEALRREGVRQFHFYTLNRSDLVYAICRVLGLGGELNSDMAENSNDRRAAVQ
ncbi:MAG TPA: methylenetetrahydrofolate reductase [NAD(P)H] [Aestuariivirgaceae bacterium]|jgi:methylenetetrahydrofolate reductase (NADPH)